MGRPLLLVVSLIFITLSLSSQPVTFTRQEQLLNPVSGFASYADCAVDMNGDRLDDVVRVGNKGIYIDYQQSNGSFTQRFFSVPLQSVPGWSICAGDIDNNGYTDLLIADLGIASFVSANNNGSFYTEAVMPDSVFSQRSTLADINNDGWLDGFICNDTDQSDPFRNNGQGIMIPDTNLIHTANRPGNYSAIWTDYDNDRDIDLYLTKCLAGSLPGDINRTNLLYQNNNDGTYSEVGALAGVDDNAQSWSTVFEDFDNDGDFDAFIVNHDAQNRLFRNNGDGTFTDVISTSGIDANDLGAWENASGDFNNDGFVDIFSELMNELYLGHGNLTFTGYDSPVTPGAISDLNNDGFLDVVKGGQLWTNDGNANHWIKIVPRGIVSNRSAIGARIELYGTWGIQIREVRSGQSFSPMSSLAIHFGLGQAEIADSIKILWPSGTVTLMSQLSADSTYFIPEASCVLPVSMLPVEGVEQICIGDTTMLFAPDGYAAYLWSNNDTVQNLLVYEPGIYNAILVDDDGCVTYTRTIEIKNIEDTPPSIFSPVGNTICQGDTLYLHSSPGKNFTWSNGSIGTSSISITESGNYTVAVDSKCSVGQLASDPFHVFVLPAPSPVSSDVIILPGDSILLSAQGEHCEWYDQPEGGNLLGVDCNYQTTILSQSETYYVESHFSYPGEIQQGGKADTTGPGGPGLQSGYLEFDAWEPFELLTVDIYVPEGSPLGTRFIQLRSGDSLLASKSFSVLPGLNVLSLNFKVPVGHHSIRCPQGNLFRNAGQVMYPYAIGDVGRITTSSFGENYYYDLYNWQIKKNDFECISERVPVEVIISASTEIDLFNTWSISPNPTHGVITIDAKRFLNESLFLLIHDMRGQLIRNEEFRSDEPFQVDITDLPVGLYNLFVSVGGKGFSKRISKI
ncbi:MAG TPA: FG-GAP-like repeat-containing protein [Saprospiraceae bacterium]